MPREELPVVSSLLQRQSHHPLLDGFPTAARIGDLPLFLGEAGAAQDAAFLEANDIHAVIALGTGNLAVKPCEVLLIDILDMEDELLLPHFDECIEFLKKYLMQEKAVLVHCVYGQSRSAATCVAYLMATQSKSLLEAYDVVQKARTCISINPGFLRQLELFERMGNDPAIMGNTPAHAELRTMVARHQRMKTGEVDVVAVPQLAHPGNSLCCRKCNYVLCTTRNQLSHTSPDVVSSGPCACIFVEPMQWMTKDPAFIRNNDGKLLCPSCKAKLGSWNWIGLNVSIGSEQNTDSRAVVMGTGSSSVNVSTLADLPSSNVKAVLAVARAIDGQTLKRFIVTTQREFHLGVGDLNALFPVLPRDAVEEAFAVFDVKRGGSVDSCELLASLVLASPQLSRDTKQKAIFQLFNVSTHRVGFMVADEATLLFRTMVAGAAKMQHSVAASTSANGSTNDMPQLAFFEDLTKALYGDQETLTLEDFARLCRETAEIDAFVMQWTFDSEQSTVQCT